MSDNAGTANLFHGTSAFGEKDQREGGRIENLKIVKDEGERERNMMAKFYECREAIGEVEAGEGLLVCGGVGFSVFSMSSKSWR